MRDRADTTHWRPHGREYSGANESCLPQEKEETVIGFKARSRFFSFSWDSCRLTLRRRRENVWPWSYRPPRNVLSTTSLKALGQAVNPTSACGYLTAPTSTRTCWSLPSDTFLFCRKKLWPRVSRRSSFDVGTFLFLCGKRNMRMKGSPLTAAEPTEK